MQIYMCVHIQRPQVNVGCLSLLGVLEFQVYVTMLTVSLVCTDSFLLTTFINCAH